MVTTPPPNPNRRAWLRGLVLPVMSLRSTYWVMGAVILLLDLITGPFLRLSILFVLPVGLAGWFIRSRTSFALAIVLPVGRALIAGFIEQPNPLPHVLANAAIRMAVLVFVAYLARLTRRTRELEQKVVQLEGILPICMFCKRIRNESEEWQRLETYISSRSKANFSHGLCPECAQERYGDILDKDRPEG